MCPPPKLRSSLVQKICRISNNTPLLYWEWTSAIQGNLFQNLSYSFIANEQLIHSADAVQRLAHTRSSDSAHFRYPCDSASGNASRLVGVDLPVNHALPSDDSALKYYYFKVVLLTRQDTKAPRTAEQ